MTLTYSDLRTKRQKRIDAEIKERVERGIVLLREKYGRNWMDHIDMETFQITDGSVCVLGQIYGDYDNGCTKLGINSDDGKYGFVIADHDDDEIRSPNGWDPWESLQQAWVAKFKEMGL